MKSEKLNVRDEEHYCKSKTKSGKPCRAAASEGGLCFFHGNPNKASELGRIGGRNNRHLLAIEISDPLPKLENGTDLRDLIARLIREVYSGKLPPRIATGLAPLMSLQLRALEATDLERRLAKLEKLAAGGKSHDLNPQDVLGASNPSNGHANDGKQHEAISPQETAD